jgi:hypothetical protein
MQAIKPNLLGMLIGLSATKYIFFALIVSPRWLPIKYTYSTKIEPLPNIYESAIQYNKRLKRNC